MKLPNPIPKRKMEITLDVVIVLSLKNSKESLSQ